MKTDKHYLKDGKKFARVTKVLSIIRKPGLEIWRGNVGNEEADRISTEAAKIGQDVHTAIMKINKAAMCGGPGPDVDPDIEEIVGKYTAWMEGNVAEILAVEKTVYNYSYQYAGTYDFLAVLKDERKPTLFDIKTGKAIDPEVPLQLAAYQGGEQGIIGRAAIHLPKDKRKLKVKLYKQEDYDYHYRLFLYALELWRFFN